jgi:carbon-monoxide dehydrogenase large subunit
MPSMIGQPVRRKEDQRLLTGQGCFADDVNMPDQVYAAMVRSPYAHARIRSIDGTAALDGGALAVLTGADCRADGLGPVPNNPLVSSPPDIRIDNRDGSETYLAKQQALPEDKARFVGEAVAVVIAETRDLAKDLAELVAVDYEALDPVSDTVAAAADGAPVLWDDLGRNVCIDGDVGDLAGTEAAVAGAHHVVRLSTTVSRVSGVPMEPRAALGIYDAETGRYTLHTTAGGAQAYRASLAQMFGVDQENVRVVLRDVGGSFGPRIALYAECPLVMWAARRVGRPVKWTSDRTETMLTDCQARDLVVDARLAVDADGRIQALATSNLSNLGAYPYSFIPLIKGVEIMPVTYALPVASARARAVMSNTPPTYPYRSAGRPEVVYAMERMIDMAARDLAIDRAEMRRRNMITQDALPFDNKLGMTYDSGDFPANLDIAVEAADWAGFEARRRAARERGRYRGIGMASYIDLSTGAPIEHTEIEVRPDGTVDVVIGTMASGQGHETSFGQMVSELLGAPYEAIHVRYGDTDVAPIGGGTHSGRSMRMGAIVITEATNKIIDKGKRIAAQVLEAAVADIAYGEGMFTVVGTDRSIGLFDVASAAAERDDLDDDIAGRLAADGEVMLRKAVFGTGCHVCEVEIDIETGVVQVVNYVAVDDVGRAINPLLIDGQTHGSVAQGLGQALMEACSYDPGTGQMRAATFLDYAMPRADNMPPFTTALTEVPEPSNPLGIKPGSEGGTAVSPAVIANAIVDALAELGVRHIELPATPERVWRAVREAERKN